MQTNMLYRIVTAEIVVLEILFLSAWIELLVLYNYIWNHMWIKFSVESLNVFIAQLAGALEYTDCTSAEG